jgi:tetratricopeptide (TPR) repeat protein
MEIDAASSAISGALRHLLAATLKTHHASGGGYLLQKSVTPGNVREIVRRHAGEADCQFLEGGSQFSHLAYGPWRQTVDALAPALPTLSPIQQNALSNLEPRSAKGASLAALSTHQSRYRLFDAVRALLQNASRERPLVMLLPDIDLHDIASVRLLQFLWPFLKNMHVLVFATTGHPPADEEDATGALEVIARSSAKTISVGRSSPAATGRPAVGEPLDLQVEQGRGAGSADYDDLCREVASWAVSVGAPEHAARYLSFALDAANGDAARMGVLRDLILMKAESGQHDELPTLISEWTDLCRTGRGTALEISAFARELSETGASHGEIAAILNLLPEETVSGAAKDLVWARIRLLDPPELVQIADGRVEVGRWIGSDPEAIRIARERGTEEDFARTLVVYDWWSKSDVNGLIARLEGWTDEVSRSRGLSVAAETLMYRHGDFRRACELLEEHCAIQEQAKSLVRLTMALLADGQLDRAYATRDKARETVDRLGPDYLIYEHSGTKSGGDLYPEISMESNFAWYREGNWLAVAEHWARAVAMHESGGSPVHIVEAAMAAQAYARLDRFDDARIYLDELVAILPHLQPRDWAFNGAVGRASHAVWDMLDTRHAADFLRYAQGLLAAGVGDWTNTSLEHTVARMAALVGDFERAGVHFARAREGFSSSQSAQRAIVDLDEAIALRLAGRDDARRDTLLAKARAGFEANRMPGWVARADAEASLSAAGAQV